MTEIGQFDLALQYVKSEDYVSDSFTRQSPGLESSLSKLFFKKIWDNFGPFKWDLMASSANVNHNLGGELLLFFSTYFDEKAQGTDVFHQQLYDLQEMFCFPPFPLIPKLLTHFATAEGIV